MPESQPSLTHYPYASRRSAVLADRGMVATSQPLAAQAGLHVLRDGGNAIDAAIATAAALTVLEPTSNGLGSDAFAIVWDGDRLHGLNGSGRWPQGNRPETLAGDDGQLLAWGWPSVTVPGAVDAWGVLHERFGALPFARVLQPALDYASDGFPVSPIIARLWRGACDHYLGLARADTQHWAGVFAPGGRAPSAGERWRAPTLARCLARLAERGSRDYYEGDIARSIADHAAQTGGALGLDDLTSHRAEWVAPIRVGYRDLEVWELPPNGQGIAALIALGILEHTPVARLAIDGVAAWHAKIEAMKLAFADAYRYVADPQHVSVPTPGLLDPAYLARRAAQVGPRASTARHGVPPAGGTVYLCTADADGLMVSFIQSNYMGFGSGVVVPDYGISLQNRAAGFVLDPEHPNAAAPGKRPRHTIIPGFLSRNGKALGPFGVMGAKCSPRVISRSSRPSPITASTLKRPWTPRAGASVPPGRSPSKPLRRPGWSARCGVAVMRSTSRTAA